MTKDCSIVISGIKNESPLYADGRFHMKDGRRYVFFEQKNDNSDTKCSLKFDEAGLQYSRHGDMDVELVLSEGQKTFAEYATPYGNFRAGFETRSYIFQETDDRIHLEAQYILELDGAGSDENTIFIDIENRTKS